jgi:hypothetical protein
METRLRSGRPGSIPGRCNDGIFFFRHHVQTDAGAHPASYPMGTDGLSFPAVKRPGVKLTSPPSSADVKNAWSYTSIPPIYLHGVALS